MATGRITVEISKPLRELLSELREEVKALRAEIAANSQTIVHCGSCTLCHPYINHGC